MNCLKEPRTRSRHSGNQNSRGSPGCRHSHRRPDPGSKRCNTVAHHRPRARHTPPTNTALSDELENSDDDDEGSEELREKSGGGGGVARICEQPEGGRMEAPNDGDWRPPRDSLSLSESLYESLSPLLALPRHLLRPRHRPPPSHPTTEPSPSSSSLPSAGCAHTPHSRRAPQPSHAPPNSLQPASQPASSPVGPQSLSSNLRPLSAFPPPSFPTIPSPPLIYQPPPPSSASLHPLSPSCLSASLPPLSKPRPASHPTITPHTNPLPSSPYALASSTPSFASGVHRFTFAPRSHPFPSSRSSPCSPRPK